MNQTLDIKPFAEELQRQHFAKRDFIADARDIRVHTDEGSGTKLYIRGVKDDFDKTQAFVVNDHAHSQLATYLQIPQAYYDRMRQSQHGLLDTSIHTWLDAAGGERRMVRTLDGRARAILSNKFRRIDNYDLANIAIAELTRNGAIFKVLQITEKKMHIKAVFPINRPIEIRPGVGDLITLGIDIENSEIGMGKASVNPWSETLSCLNGATHTKYGLERRHVGARIQGGEEAYELFSDEAMKADDEALMLKFRDIVIATANEKVLESIVADMKQAAGVPINTIPAYAVTELAKTKGLSENEEGGILRYLLEGGELSQYGLGQAVTRYAQDVENDYDRTDELQHLGGDILSMAREEFGPIANANQPKPRRNRAA